MVAFITAQERKQMVEAMPRVRIDLPSASIDGALNGVIPFALLSKGLTFRIPWFEGQREGATFHAIVEAKYSNGWGLGGTIKTADGDTTLEIPAERALALRGQEVNVYYFYFEADPNRSPATDYLVEDEIYRPVIDGVEGNVISSALADQGVNLRLRESASLSTGALVSLFCHGSDCESSWVNYFRIEADDAGKDVVIAVEPRYLKPNKYGAIEIVYTVSNAGRQWISPVSVFQVEGDLLSPVPDHGILGHYTPGNLEKVDESGRTPLTLSTHGMSVGDALTFVFWGSDIGTVYVLQQTLGAHQIGLDLKIKVPYRPDHLGTEANAFSIIERVSGGTVGSPLMQLSIWPD
ncbi:hypothetical protein DLD99_21250 [Pseudomonas kribbensis]|uniref:Uncharacterized protein n=1 Tax=Pseudomonas kribbensis TaxID=1628086 RepID=A0A345RUD4_9PSED|nr:hypothetical protein [Pseudomonas kribbensis]AXI62900.1 hypothetical protein DLD99_21250 [Pseudomonas kribbensis]